MFARVQDHSQFRMLPGANRVAAGSFQLQSHYSKILVGLRIPPDQSHIPMIPARLESPDEHLTFQSLAANTHIYRPDSTPDSNTLDIDFSTYQRCPLGIILPQTNSVEWVFIPKILFPVSYYRLPSIKYIRG